MHYTANPARYDAMPYRRCGKSGLLLPALSLGLWHNFGANAPYETCRAMLLGAFDHGVTHIDIANNYGPPEGAAEETFGRVLNEDLRPHRDEFIISTKAGYHMWSGPYGEWGSRKALISSLDQSLRRTGLDYFDIFYHHRPDPNTPLEETMGTLADIVKSGKALYVGISNYNAADTRKAVKTLADKGVHCLIHQMRYSLLHRKTEPVIAALGDLGVGSIAFSALAQGVLTCKYANGIPAGSRAATDKRFLNARNIDPADVQKSARLAEVAARRGQSPAQMALAWVLRKGGVTSAIIGASCTEQIEENIAALQNLAFSPEELGEIDRIVQ